MINPDRPLIIYESMELDLERLDLADPSLNLEKTTLEVKGKRGQVTLQFSLKDGRQAVGHGTKKMVLSGLRPYDAERMQEVVAGYNHRMNGNDA